MSNYIPSDDGLRWEPDRPDVSTEGWAEVTVQVTRADGTVEPAETVYSDNHPHNQENQ